MNILLCIEFTCILDFLIYSKGFKSEIELYILIAIADCTKTTLFELIFLFHILLLYYTLRVGEAQNYHYYNFLIMY